MTASHVLRKALHKQSDCNHRVHEWSLNRNRKIEITEGWTAKVFLSVAWWESAAIVFILWITVLWPAPSIDTVSAPSFSPFLCTSVKYDRNFWISGRRWMDDRNSQVWLKVLCTPQSAVKSTSLCTPPALCPPSCVWFYSCAVCRGTLYNPVDRSIERWLSLRCQTTNSPVVCFVKTNFMQRFISYLLFRRYLEGSES